MEKLIYSLILGLALLASCKKEDPVIADPNELAYTNYSEYMICQPVAYGDNMVAVINKNNSNLLCSYDRDGNKNWQQDIDGYIIGSYTYETIDIVSLAKDKQDNLLLLMYTTTPNVSVNSVSQNIRAVKFNAGGQYISMAPDTIHQHDTIIIALDTISIAAKRPFIADGFVSFSDGNYAVVSSQYAGAQDSTYLQLSIYDSSTQFVRDSFLIIPGRRNFIDVYSTSDNHLFLPGRLENGDDFYLMIDLQGNILFEIPTQGLLNTYFFHENSSGDYIISSAYVDQSIILRGVVFCINNSGEGQWINAFTFNPSWVMLSMQELSDGYLFTGFTNSSLLLTGVDWRTSFLQEEHHAVIQKTDLSGTEQWNQILTGNFFSSGAVAFGNDPISFYGGKYEPSIQNVFLIKLNNDGTISD